MKIITSVHLAVCAAHTSSSQKQQHSNNNFLYDLCKRKPAVAATLLAIGTMKSKYSSQQDVWQLQYEKAVTYLTSQGIIDVDGCCGAAELLVS